MRTSNWNAFQLALLTQLASYRQRVWEPLLIVLAIFVASAGLSAVTLINLGAKQQLTQLQFGEASVSWHLVAKSDQHALSKSDYANLKRKFTSNAVNLVAYVYNDEQASYAVDTLALFSVFPAPTQAHNQNTAQHNEQVSTQQSTLVDLNQFYQGERTPLSHPLTGIAVIGELDPNTRNQLLAELPTHLALSPITAKNKASNLTDSFALNLWAMSMLMILVSLFIVFNALNLLLVARNPTLIKLRQLGIHRRTLISTLILEMSVLATLATLLGTVISSAAIGHLAPTLNHIYSMLFDSRFNHDEISLLRLSLQSIVVMGCAVVGILLLSLFGRHIARLKPANSGPQHRPTMTIRQLIGLMLALVILSIGAIGVYSQLSALLYIGLVLLVGCATIILLIPEALRVLTKLAPVSKPVIHWSMHNAIALSRRTKLAASAFFIALAANIGMNVMVDSFKNATEHWLEQRLFAPIYIYSNAESDLSASADVPVQLLARYGKDIVYQGQKIEIRSFPTDEKFQQHLLLDSQSPDAWSAFYQHEGVFINQQLAYRANLKVGSTLRGQALLSVLPTSPSTHAPEPVLKATSESVTVIGIYPDYGNPKGQILLPDAALSQVSEKITAYAAFVTDEKEQNKLQTWLSTQDEDARLFTRQQLIEQSMVIFARTFTTTDTLNLVTMLVAALSFFVSISLLVLDIRPQLVLLRSTGVHSQHIKGALFMQYALIAMTCAILAVPFALLLAWLLVNKVNRFAFAWTYPLQLDPAVVLQSMLIGLGLILVLLLLPMGKLQAKFSAQQGAE